MKSLRLKNILKEMSTDIVKGGLSNGMSLEDIAKKHGVDITDLQTQFDMGVKVEMEHTDNEELAGEIAKDHLFEDPEYYTKLKSIEGGE
jgi:hypothetical protein